MSAAQPIAVTRREAARMLSVSVDTITRAKQEGKLHPRTPNLRKDGTPTKELYDVNELREWFQTMEPA